MSTSGATLPIEAEESGAREIRSSRRKSLIGPALVLPALIVTILFSIVPLVYLAIVSLTEKSSFFFRNTVYTFSNYSIVWDRYLPNIETTVRLAILSSLIDLVFGY